MNMESLELVSLSVKKYYNEGASKEAVTAAKALQADIAKHLKEVSGEIFTESFYEPLVFIVENEREKIAQNLSHVTLQGLSLIGVVLVCIRNSFYKNALNQKMVGEKEKFQKPLVATLSILIEDLFPYIKNSKQGTQPCKMEERRADANELESSLCNTMPVCITLFVNMMAGNSMVRKIMWPFLHPLILSVVSFPTPEVSHTGAALLHQFIIEEELKQEIFKSDLAASLVPPLLKAYIVKGPHACFSLFCLEVLIEAPEAIPSSWEKLSAEESLLLLDILTSLIQKKRTNIPFVTVHFLQEIFKKGADKVFGVYDNRMTSHEPSVITRMTNFLGCAASSDHFRSHLQDDKSLLISTVYLLKGVTEIGDVSRNAFSRLGDSDQTDGELESHPAFGFKSNLIRLIAGLVYRNKSNQDKVREIDGILLLLENSQFDARNPLIREASIFALRNLLEGNYENQEIISSLKLEGVAENKVLDQLGLGVSIQAGKLAFHQK